MEDGKEKTVEYIFDERQISKIWYVPVKTIKTAGGSRRNYQKDGGVNQRDEFVWLDCDWIKKIFPIHSLVLQKIQEKEGLRVMFEYQRAPQKIILNRCHYIQPHQVHQK
jgi:hypothetical protein